MSPSWLGLASGVPFKETSLLLRNSCRYSVGLTPHISTLVGDVNRLVYESSPTHFFACLFYAEYEPSTRVLKYVNAGHNPPIVIRRVKGTVDLFYLKPANSPVGVSPDLQFVTSTFQLETDDIIVAYTDGITEAENRDGDLWGQERFENLLRSCGGSTAEQIVKCILDQVSAFAEGQRQRDDMTLVVMKVQRGYNIRNIRNTSFFQNGCNHDDVVLHRGCQIQE